MPLWPEVTSAQVDRVKRGHSHQYGVIGKDDRLCTRSCTATDGVYLSNLIWGWHVSGPKPTITMGLSGGDLWRILAHLKQGNRIDTVGI